MIEEDIIRGFQFPLFEKKNKKQALKILKHAASIKK